MHPSITLDPLAVAQNFRAWQSFAGVPVRPVIKCNAYNWGYERLIALLDPLCETYCVGDVEEFKAARRFTKHAIVILGAVPVAQLTDVLEAGGIPTIGSLDEIEAASRWAAARGVRARVRVGVLPAAGWSGIDLAAIETLAPHLAASPIDIEIWSHITDAGAAPRQKARLAQAVQSVRSPGGRVVGTDLASTHSLARDGANGQSVRVGIGLFGSTGGPAVPGVRCALRVNAPVTAVAFHRAGTKVGYGDVKLQQDGYVVTARCGYGDGLPKGLANTSDILSVGMQYVTMRAPHEPFEEADVALLDADTNLDEFAAVAGVGPHEIVTAFGNASTGELVST